MGRGGIFTTNALSPHTNLKMMIAKVAFATCVSLLLLHSVLALSSEETSLLADIARCIVTKNFNPGGLSALLKGSSDAADVQTAVSHPAVVNVAKITLLHGALAQSLAFGQMNPLLLTRAMPVTRGLDGQPAGSAFSSTEALIAKQIAEMQRRYVAKAAEDVRKATEAAQKAATLKKALDEVFKKVARGDALTREQSAILRRMRMQAIGKQMALGTGISAGLSVVINIKILIAGEVSKYFVAVASDTGVSIASQIVGMGLDRCVLDGLGAGATVIVMGLIDGVRAAQTGDWSRFGLNTIVNTGAAATAALGAKAGMAIGSAFSPVGSAVGGLLGAVIGGITGRLLLTATPLGHMTAAESRAAVRKVAKEINLHLEPYGLELDPSVSFAELSRKLKKGDVPVKITKDFAQAAKHALTLPQVNALLGKTAVSSFLDFAAVLAPARVEGLRLIKRAMGC